MRTFLLFLFACLITFQSQAQLMVNEFCYDPASSGIDGDCNGDGVSSQSQDEFIEFLNAGSDPLDVSGYRIYDKVLATGQMTLRHTFEAGTVLPSLGALVVFGGGTPRGDFGGAMIQVSRGAQGLSMNNFGESVIITDSHGDLVDSIMTDTRPDDPNESYTRSPDITGDFVPYHMARADFHFSPGLYINGLPFVVSVRQRLSARPLACYPNPAVGSVTLPPMQADAVLTVTDGLGRAVTPARQGNRLDFAGMPAGLYAIRLEQRGQAYAGRVLITQ